MRRKWPVLMMAAAMASASALQGVAAQPGYSQQGYQQPGYYGGVNDYQEGYRDGYREGYDDGRNRVRYDDRAPGYYQPPGAGPYGDPDQLWRQRYQQTYSYNDDVYYRECRNQADPAGVIAGALIGGILGNVLGQNTRSRGVATIAGVVLGGALGSQLTRNLNCEDRSYAYKTYYDGFNAGRANVPYQWRNPRSGNYGEFRVDSYYNDPVGFRCANFTQQIFIRGRPQVARGRACQQPDGTWTIVG
jgi:surface antigen